MSRALTPCFASCIVSVMSELTALGCQNLLSLSLGSVFTCVQCSAPVLVMKLLQSLLCGLQWIPQEGLTGTLFPEYMPGVTIHLQLLCLKIVLVGYNTFRLVCT